MADGDDAAARPVVAFDRVNTILSCHRWEETMAFYRDALRLVMTIMGCQHPGRQGADPARR